MKRKQCTVLYKAINQDTTKHFLTFDVSVSTRDLPQEKFVYFFFRFLPR